ncbi:MAG: hypothetical protein KA007_02775 [Candidatus Pacebacteria bacterium]|nr:hypothetical protein [Candidatus Paceibacterota bacterium]
MSLLSLFMNQEDKRDLKNWTKEETDRVVAVFQWLLDQDRKQNPDRYKLPKGVVLDKDGNQVIL